VGIRNWAPVLGEAATALLKAVWWDLRLASLLTHLFFFTGKSLKSEKMTSAQFREIAGNLAGVILHWRSFRKAHSLTWHELN